MEGTLNGEWHSHDVDKKQKRNTELFKHFCFPFSHWQVTGKSSSSFGPANMLRHLAYYIEKWKIFTREMC